MQSLNADELAENVSQVVNKVSYEYLITAAVIFVVALLLDRLIKRVLKRILSKTKMKPSIRKSIMGTVRVIFWIITALIIASVLGINTTSLIALISVFSLGITLALEDIIGNMAGGLVLASTKSFSEGDYISASGVEGTVIDSKLGYTTLRNVDGLLVTVPNKGLATSNITNYSSYGRRRMVITVGASYNDDSEKVRAALLDLMMKQEKILKDPEPVVYITEYGDSSIMYSMILWTTPGDYLNVKYVLTDAVRDAFDKNGLTMDYNHLNVHMVE